MTHDAHEALKAAIGHIEHMAAWITATKIDTYSFESLGEDMPGLREALTASAPEGEPVAWRYRFITSVQRDWSDWFIVDDEKSIPARPLPDIEIEPLYTSPPPAAGWDREKITRALHAVDCAEADRDRVLAKLPPVTKWADPWLPSSKHQLNALLRRADVFLQALCREAPAPEGVADIDAAAARYSIPLYTTYPASAFCEDCPPVGYPTDKTRCLPCPRRRGDHETIARAWQDLLDKDDRTSPEEYPDMALITFDEFKDALTQLRAPTAPQADQNAEKIRDYCTINWQLSTNNKIRIAKIYDNRQNEMLDADNAESCKHFYEALRKIAMGDPDAVAVAMEAVKMPWLWDQSVDVTVEELTEWIASENRRWDGAKSFARALLDAYEIRRR